MDLHIVDFCMSGLAKQTIATTAEKILQIDPIARILEIVAWSSNEHINRTVFEKDAGVKDMEGVIEIDYNEISKMMVMIEPVVSGVSTKMNLTAYGNEVGSILEGQLYLDHILRSGVSPKDALLELSELFMKIASVLNLSFLVLADEDNELSIIHKSGLRVPILFGVYKKNLLLEVEKDLTMHGAVISQSANSSYETVWLDHLDNLLQQEKPSPKISEVLGSHMRGLI